MLNIIGYINKHRQTKPDDEYLIEEIFDNAISLLALEPAHILSLSII